MTSKISLLKSWADVQDIFKMVRLKISTKISTNWFLYSIFGIPLVVFVLTDLGKVWLKYGRKLWQYIVYCDSTLRNRSLSTQRVPSISTETTDFEPLVHFPLSVGIVILTIYIFLCAGVFLMLEPDWDYFTSVYFCFISISTIGLGDFSRNLKMSTVPTVILGCLIQNRKNFRKIERKISLQLKIIGTVFFFDCIEKELENLEWENL